MSEEVLNLRCNWCGKGLGKNFTKASNGDIYYYYCSDCIGFINKELNPMSAFYRERDKRNFRRMKIEVLERNFKRLQHFLDIYLRGNLTYPKEYEEWDKDLINDKEAYEIK